MALNSKMSYLEETHMMNINFQSVANKAQKHIDMVHDNVKVHFNILLIMNAISYRIHSTLINIVI